ncbi:MAG: dihydroorotase, partial [Paracoccus sp. (in: a-proteobacteria)]
MTAILFSNARLIDPEAGTDGPGSLLVRDGRIGGRGAPDEAAPEGAEIVDCGGRVLAPGLIDWGVKIGEPG